MLEQIVFLIKDRAQMKNAQKLKDRMDPNGNWIEIWSIVGKETDGKEESVCLQLYNKKQVLFVTDESLIMWKLRQQGNYVIGLLHQDNSTQDWSGAGYMVMDIGQLEEDSFVKAYQRMAGEPWTILETERCIVRETTVADVDEFYRIYAEPSITRYMDDLYGQPCQEREYIREYIEKVYGFYGYGMWSIVNKTTGSVMGRAGLSWREGYDIPELGFVIEAAYQRMGYAEEVCRAIAEYGKTELGFDRMQALIKAENEASVGLCRKLGFVRLKEVEEGGEEYEYYLCVMR